MASANDWNLTEQIRPEEESVVEAITPSGAQQTFYFYRGLWFLEDRSMYCYFTPTHWRYLDDHRD